MSDIAAHSETPQRSRIKFVIIVLSILFLFLAYGAGIFVLPISLLASYHNKDCGFVAGLHTTYTTIYPNLIEDQTLLFPVQECEAYTLAAAYETEGNWQEAYDAYQAYSTSYSSGLFAKEVHQQSAVVLMNVINDQLHQKLYEEALTNLKQMVSSYSDTAVSEESLSLFPSTYISWGAGLRETGDFTRSEQVLNEFKAWTESSQKPDVAVDAQRELAQTYLAWGLDLQSQKQFEPALAKFDQADSADPKSLFDLAAQVQAGRSSVYIEWGNDLLEQKQFDAALKRFELAISKSGDTKEDAHDALANGQVRWAQSLSTDEDFQEALEHLESAGKAAGSDTMKKSVETALQDTYLAFSQSSGPQARQAMKEVLETVCRGEREPLLPIFGLNEETVRFGIYGVEETLPQDLAARTPGEMHYIACITPDNKTVETRLHRNLVLDFGRYDFYTLVEQFRVQVVWDVSLLSTETGESAGEETFTGEQPPPFSETGGNYIYGAAPIEELNLWLESFLE